MKKILLVFSILAACSTNSGPNSCLRISLNTQPTTLDPRKAGDFVSSTLICLLYEGLTRAAPGGGAELAMADRVTVSKDEKIYIFHLRNAFWSDGMPVTAYDFEQSWKKTLSPPSLCAYLFYPIKNAKEFTKGEIRIEEVGIKALDERTLRVELEQPTPYFYSLTSFPSFLPLPSHIEDFENGSVCNGPFYIESMSRNSEIKLAKNRKFWNQEKIFLDAIHISIIPDEMTAYQMFERGDLDWIGGPLSPLPPDALEKLKDRISLIPSCATTLCTFNTQTFPFQNIHLRKAFAFALNRKEIVERVALTKDCHDTSFLPPALINHPSELSDPESARAHLQQALNELEIAPRDLESLCLYYKPSQIERRIAQTIQRQWKEVLGITVKLVQLDYKSHAARLHNRDYQISLASWIAQFDDPISILERFKDSSNLKNYPGWENSHYAALLNKAEGSPQRLALLEEALALFEDAMPLTPIYHWSFPTLSSPRVVTAGATPVGGILFERFRIIE